MRQMLTAGPQLRGGCSNLASAKVFKLFFEIIFIHFIILVYPIPIPLPTYVCPPLNYFCPSIICFLVAILVSRFHHQTIPRKYDKKAEDWITNRNSLVEIWLYLHARLS